MNRLFNRKSNSRPTGTPAKHEHLFEWLEIDWGVFAWICVCGMTYDLTTLMGEGIYTDEGDEE